MIDANEAMTAEYRIRMHWFHEDEPSPLMQPEEDDGCREDVMTVARFARAALPLWQAVQEMPGEVVDAMERLRRCQSGEDVKTVYDDKINSGSGLAGVLIDRAKVSDWALTLTARLEPKS